MNERKDTFINTTFLYEQSGGSLDHVLGSLGHVIDYRLLRIIQSDWCPPDIRSALNLSISDLQDAQARIEKLRDLLAETKRRQVPQRIANEPRLCKLIVIHGGGRKDRERLEDHDGAAPGPRGRRR